MKVRALFVTLIFLASAIFVIIESNQMGSAQTLLLNDTPILDESPVQDDYEFEVLAGEHAIVGVRPKMGNNNDLEIYTDNTYTTMIESSINGGDAVDFVSLYKDAWTSPPNRGAKVTAGSREFVIEIENQVDSHNVFDSWGGSMDKIQGNPVMEVGPPGSWDDTYAYFPSVIYEGGIYRMWYSGFDGFNVRIGYATSSDGLTWTKYAGNPVLDLGTGWEDEHVHYPNVIYYGGEYKMWYSGMDGSNYKIGYASSPDGTTWTKHSGNPVLSTGSSGAWDDTYAGQASVLVEAGTYHMWYSGVKSGGIGKTGYATSPDGISWTKYGGNPVMDIGPGGSWDDFRAYGPSVVSNGTRYFMSYMGNDGSIYRIGYAYSDDKINWVKSPANPILDLGPGGSWESNALGGCSLFYDAPNFKLWYHGGDGSITQTGYAVLPLMDNWEKYSGNPVLDIGAGGEWDDTSVRSPSILFDGTTYHMWYSGNGGPIWKIGYATSNDGKNWNKYAGNPVLDITANWWEDGGVLEPYVLFDGTTYHMWYSGDDGTTTRRVGYANSTDGINWNRYSGNPILDIGTSGKWDDDSVYADTVYFDGLSYHMWYTGDDGPRHRCGYATSPDGLTWTKPNLGLFIYGGNSNNNIVLDLGTSGSWEDEHVYRPRVLVDGSNYQLWYGGGDGSVIKVGYATSSNGINWQKFPGNPVIDNGPPASFDDEFVFPSNVFYDGQTYHMWYTSRDGSTYRIGYANIPWKRTAEYAEVIDAFEITGFKNGVEYTIDLNIPPTADLDLFIYTATGGRDDAHASSINIGTGIDESITFTAPFTGDYLLVITNEDGGTGAYTISFTGESPIIANVDAQPDPQEVYGSVNISAVITDDNILYGAWVEVRDPLGGLIGNYSMFDTTGLDKFYLVRTYNMLGQYSFTIWANDTSDRWSSVSSTFTIQDTTPPTITDITSFPDPQEVFGFVRISTDITDNYQLDGSWIGIYDPGSSFVGNYSLSYDSIYDRWYLEDAFDNLGDYTFTIWAKDSESNWNSESDSFTIVDTTPPIIEDVTTTPDPQEVFDSINVSAKITDNYQLSGTWIEIRDPNGAMVGNYTLYHDSISGKYHFELPYDIIGTYSFKITANDTENNWGSYSGTFEIQDTVAPNILDANEIPDPQEVFGTVTISAIVTDNYELDNIWIEVRNPNGELVVDFPMEYSMPEMRYIWNQSYDLLGTFTYTIRANDTSNNLAPVSGSFVIHDTTPPVISSILVEPGLHNILEPLNISALAYDNYQVLGLWLEIKDPDGFIIENYSLDYLDDNERYYRNNTYISSGVYKFTIWASDTSDNWASTTGSFEIEPEEGPDEYNWKPLIAILFAIILLIVGIIIVMIKPMKFTGELGRDRTYSFFAGVLPFVIAELITGLVSFFTDHLAVPPILGVGMIVDLAILIVGLVVCIVIYIKGEPYQSYDKKVSQPPSDEQVPQKTFQLDETKAPLSSPESPEPITPPETHPPSPVPQPEEPPPPTPEPDEESPPTPPSPFE